MNRTLAKYLHLNYTIHQMATEECGLTIFEGTALSEEEIRELDSISHAQLLNEAFTQLAAELDEHGNTDRFEQLRREHAAKIIAYWQAKIQIYEQALAEGKISQMGQPLERGHERLTLWRSEDYHTEDQTLGVARKTSTEEDELNLTWDYFSGIDPFHRPPKIESKIRTDPDESPDIYYTLILRPNMFVVGSVFRISTFQRAIMREDPEYKKSPVKDIRILDCTGFGVEGSFQTD